MSERKWTGVIGLMSGTSLDGLDCCYVEFCSENGRYSFRNLISKTYPYSPAWQKDLKQAFYLKKTALDLLDLNYGKFLAASVNQFIKQNKLNGSVDLISSHGHTVFHQPQNGITVQIGNGAVLNKLTGIRVINDFRILDVTLGGQGAPLVPVGDHLLFSDYSACLNLGGFSNISFIFEGNRIAFDISPCNLPLNELCNKYLNLEFDRGGEIAAAGKHIDSLFQALNGLAFYSKNPPKSLGYEWLKTEFEPVLNTFQTEKPADLIRTVTDHVVFQILAVLKKYNLKDILVTGGGAYNRYLIDNLRNSHPNIVIPSPQIIEFKEALIFAFLGYLNLNDTINTFRSVTGANADSMGGIRHFSHQQ